MLLYFCCKAIVCMQRRNIQPAASTADSCRAWMKFDEKETRPASAGGVGFEGKEAVLEGGREAEGAGGGLAGGFEADGGERDPRV